MLFGHNSNVEVGPQTYHVQTEDHGPGRPLLETTVYCRGQILHRRTAAYADLLPLTSEREAILKSRLDDQHRTVVQELQGGKLPLGSPPA